MSQWTKGCIALFVMSLATEAQGKAVHFDQSLLENTGDPNNVYCQQLWYARETYCGGDQVFLKRGQVFVGTLKIAFSPS